MGKLFICHVDRCVTHYLGILKCCIIDDCHIRYTVVVIHFPTYAVFHVGKPLFDRGKKY